jgi:septal ring factor EnvC (AmiA/AmiB activator)
MTGRTLLACTIGLVLGALLLAGCLSVNAQAPKTIGTDSSSAQTQTPPPDGRTTAQLIEENNALRKRLAALEKTNQDMEDALKQRQDHLRQLEKQAKETQKELDRLQKESD